MEAVVRGLADEVDAEGDDGKQRVPALNLVTIALNISSSPAPSGKKKAMMAMPRWGGVEHLVPLPHQATMGVPPPLVSQPE